MSDTMRLCKMTDLINYLEFKLSEITALKQFSKSADSSIIRENERPVLVMKGSGKIKKDKCEMLHVQNYEENCKFLFISHLHDNRDEQFK